MKVTMYLYDDNEAEPLQYKTSYTLGFTDYAVVACCVVPTSENISCCLSYKYINAHYKYVVSTFMQQFSQKLIVINNDNI